MHEDRLQRVPLQPTPRGRFGTSLLLTLALPLSLCAFGSNCHSRADEPPRPTARIQFNIRDESGAPLPCRVHLKNERGEPQRAFGQPFWYDHFVCSGRVAADVEPGMYRYQIERGPEYQPASGTVDAAADRTTPVEITLQRIARLRDEGWYAADLHVHRPLEEIEALMLAEDLDFAPVITWWNASSRWGPDDVPQPIVRQFAGHRRYTILAGEDEREGGALLFFGLPKPLDLRSASREYPSPMHFVEQAREQHEHVWIDVEKPFWWDLPTWLATGKMNSIGIANNHMCRDQMLPNEAWGKPRDADRLPNPRGNGYWSQEIYYHVLNTGLRLPPSAGSASGVLPNPVGYNRVYARLEQPFSRDAWFAALARGQCFVTNGPLLRGAANGQGPGATLEVPGDRPAHIELTVHLTSNDRVPALELIYNGRVVQAIACSDAIDQRQKLSFEANEPGWFLVRAIADVEETFRFASTAPWYLERVAQPRRISQRSAQFFLDWTDERIARVKANVTNERQRGEVLDWHERGRRFWSDQVRSANAP